MIDIEGRIRTLLERLTASRAGYLDNINNAELLNVPDISTLTATRIGYLDFLNSDSKYLISTALSGTELANSIGRLIYELGVNRLTETRAGYLDEAISAAKTLTAATITSIRQSVCADTDPASSIGKLLYDNLNAPVGSIPTNPTLQTVWTDARAGYLDNINQAGLLDVTAARAGYLDILNSDSKYLISNALPGTEVADSIADKIKSILADTGTDGVVVNSRTSAYSRQAGVTQVIEVSVTSAANAGDVIIATVTDQPCVIDSIIIHADTAQTADLTSCGIYGGTNKVITFISASDATQSNLDAADRQVAWTGAVRLAATKTIVMNLVGTGTSAVDLTVTIVYKAAVSGGHLA